MTECSADRDLHVCLLFFSSSTFVLRVMRFIICYQYILVILVTTIIYLVASVRSDLGSSNQAIASCDKAHIKRGEAHVISRRAICRDCGNDTVVDFEGTDFCTDCGKNARETSVQSLLWRTSSESSQDQGYRFKRPSQLLQQQASTRQKFSQINRKESGTSGKRRAERPKQERLKKATAHAVQGPS